MRLSAALIAGALALAGCSGASGRPDGGPPDAGPGPGHRVPDALLACAASPTPVGSIAQAVGRLNALPPPVTAACFVASLARPVDVVATSSVVSLQPAAGARSPRIFVLEQGVVLSVVPEGDAGLLLELGEWDTPLRTLKGEIELPVTAPLDAGAPFARIKTGAGATTCGICHRQESPSATVTDGFVSAAFRPAPGELVKVSALAAEHQGCADAGTSSQRCDLFHALFDFGEVRQGAFPTSVELFIP